MPQSPLSAGSRSPRHARGFSLTELLVVVAILAILLALLLPVFGAVSRYHQLRRELLPYGQKLADGAATPDERTRHDRIEAAAKAEQLRLSRLMWRDGRSAEDRAAMSWIMFGPTAATPNRTP